MDVKAYKAANTRYYWVLVTLSIGAVWIITMTRGLEGISSWLQTFDEIPNWIIDNLALIETVLVLVPIFWISNRFALNCKNCGKTLAPQKSELIISTKNCPECGNQAID